MSVLKFPPNDTTEGTTNRRGGAVGESLRPASMTVMSLFTEENMHSV